MKTVILTIFLIASLVYVYYRYGACGFCGGAVAEEGFQTKQKQPPNPLVKLVKKLSTMSKYLSDPGMWKERISMVNMTPIELARRHLDQTKRLTKMP